MASSKNFAIEHFEKLARTREIELATAEREAHASGKEPFDFERFAALLNRGQRARLRAREYRSDYYVSHPELRTMAEYVAFLHENEPWEDCP
ncbi:MAG: hypothetical protein ACXWP4_25820 [Polyangiales bacterium]